MGLSKYDVAPVGESFGKWEVMEYSHHDNPNQLIKVPPMRKPKDEPSTEG